VPIGSAVTITLSFQRAGDVKLSIPVATAPSASPRSPNPKVDNAGE
jgi:hypothetical protein